MTADQYGLPRGAGVIRDHPDTVTANLAVIKRQTLITAALAEGRRMDAITGRLIMKQHPSCWTHKQSIRGNFFIRVFTADRGRGNTLGAAAGPRRASTD